MRTRLLALACLALVAPTAQACRCPVEPGPAAAFRRADLVVLADVVQVETEAPRGAVKATLRVKRSWKAPAGAELVVFTRTTCAYDFKAGDALLVYSYRDKRLDRMETRKCMGNQPESQAQAALHWLDRHGHPASAPSR